MRRRATLVAAVLVVAVIAVVVLALTRPWRESGEPVLVDPGEVPGVVEASQNARGGSTPGWTWCDGIGSHLYAPTDAPSTWLSFGSAGDAGAVLMDRHRDGASAEYLIDTITEQAEVCAASSTVARGSSIEPLAGLDDGEVGWRTERADGEWGEYVLVPIDEWRVLAVGFATKEASAPVDLYDLVSIAREGAQTVPTRTNR